MVHGDLRGLCSMPEACGMGGNGEMHAQIVHAPPVLLLYSMLIQGLGVSLFIYSLANHAAGVPTVISTHPGIQSLVF